MYTLLKSLIYTLPIWLFLVLLYVLSATDPVSAGPGGILLVFFVIYAMIASLLFTILHWGVRVVTALIITRNKRLSTRSYKIGVRKAYYMASIIAFGPVLLLALNSVRQLKATDVLLVLLFLTLALFYILKRDS
jgi:hypothetical protein